jgi:catechol 2,3-dioxygenase-like lactoylglutathione lyase family enzyme
MKKFKSFSSLSVNDIDKAREFYVGILDLDSVSEPVDTVLMFDTGGDTRFMVYQKDDHQPAIHTVLNFEVDDIEAVVANLTDKGVKLEHVEDANEKGIADQGPIRAAWFKDPAGNWLGVFQGV